MGQAKQRGTKAERIAQAQLRPQKPVSNKPPSQEEMMKLATIAQRLDPLINAITTPETINEQVVQFASQLSHQAPLLLACEPELWSRESCCDLNVEKYVEGHGGRMLCGYRVWYAAPRYIEGERHAVWTDGDTIRDVSFAGSGEIQTVFVPDDLDFDAAPAKVRHVFEEDDKAALAAYERMSEVMSQFMSTHKPSAAQAWKQARTYESWLAGNTASA
ncbi:hypothetical protein NLK61_25400 [Pseudomonas fuscovaginae UPB0736]|uniref:hypothetical protein n=1 Tax=Pseudomonas asplenii TaxID=53407 RepID=UPI0012F784C8|nr:hypothetical protein [Pseudomonas fuscovaginae]UUQ64506.1 hypothetical protein NLK61_25400 [Pseudomonas fuscovaginae UPB0736]